MGLTRGDLEILESELSSHLYVEFAAEVMSGHIPKDFGKRLKTEMRRWRETSMGDALPVNIVGAFHCKIDFTYPPDPSNPPRFGVQFVLEGPPLWGWDDDPLEL